MVQGLSQQQIMKRRHNRVGLAAGGVAVFMLGAAYAAVPIYKLICQATGLGGTTGAGAP